MVAGTSFRKAMSPSRQPGSSVSIADGRPRALPVLFWKDASMFDAHNAHTRILNARLSRRRAAALGAGAAGLGIAGNPLGFHLHAQERSTINLASNASDPAPRERLAGQIENFNASQDQYTVEINTTAHEDFKQAIRTYLASDSPPDVLTWFAGNRMRFFSNNNLLMPLDDLYTEN